ncbi:MAG: protease modulator HflK N-terminal domain-containing protein, partial [Rhizobiales bacterium]|nr:protease modulator HflK N-terminal domain-containing protein [Hyphomicrobiales bacterium]
MPWKNQGGGPWGSGPKGPWGSGPQSPGPRPPDLEDLLRRGQDRLQSILPGGHMSTMGILLLIVAALAIWGLSGFFRVQPNELGAVVTDSLAHANEIARGDALRRFVTEIAVIGGAEIYAQAMPFADRLEVT